MIKSFTLVEMVIVIAIIAILGTIVAPNAFKMIEKAKLAGAANNFKTIAAAASAYFADTTVYPICDDLYCSQPATYPKPMCFGLDFFRNEANRVGWSGPYLQKWPSPPWVSPNGAPPEFQWQGPWAEFNGNGNPDESIELNFITNDEAFAKYRGEIIDRALDDGNLSTGNFLWGKAFTPPVPPGCDYCLFYNAGEH